MATRRTRTFARACIRGSVLPLLVCIGILHATPEIIFAGDFDSSQPIQWVRRHSVQNAGVSIQSGPAWVSAAKTCSMMGNYTLYLQVPAQLNADADYPEYSALKVFGTCAGFAPSAGDCIDIEGVMIQFNGATELNQAVFTELPPQDCGSTPVTPYGNAPLADVASDTNLVTPQFEPGPRAEALESVLLTVTFVKALTGTDGSGDFQVVTQAFPGPVLVIGNTLYQYPASSSMSLTSITGVLDQQDSGGNTVFQLLPRDSADVVP